MNKKINNLNISPLRILAYNKICHLLLYPTSEIKWFELMTI